jgi:hypothetical protein
MTVSTIQQRAMPDGTTIVEALVHVAPDQAGAAADALRGLVSARYRVPALSTDEILAMRELTALGDAFDDLRAAAGITVLPLTVARLALVVDAFHQAPVGPGVALLHTLEDAHAEALRVALSGEPALS